MRGTSDERPQLAQGKTCSGCGSVNHTASYYGCPAKDAQCNSCKKSILDAAVLSVSVCSEDVEVMERFTYLGSDIHVSVSQRSIDVWVGPGES